jgi:membrane-associated protease RseP (regulator of RpoE activity)
LWWLAVINFSVALINMWPVGIFDGGRMFMLTVWSITGSEKFAQIAFKVATYVILGALLLLMIGWFGAVF